MVQPARKQPGLPPNWRLLGEFSELLNQDDYSENTRRAYLRFVEPFLDKERPSPEQLDRYEVGRFILEWRNQLSNSSLRLATSALIKFYKFLKFYHGFEQADVVINHIKDLKGEFFRTQAFQPDPLNTDEIMTLYQYALGDGKRQIRRRCILTVLLGTGLRVSEFCALTRERVVLHEVGVPSHLYIPRGKTPSAQRKIPLHRDFPYTGQWILGERVVQAIDRYMEVRPEPSTCHTSPPSPFDGERDNVDPRTDQFVFISEQGTPLSRRSVQGMISRLAEKSGLQEKRADQGLGSISVHNLRHTFATQLARKGANAHQIKAILGHASVSTSQAYIRLIDRVG